MIFHIYKASESASRFCASYEDDEERQRFYDSRPALDATVQWVHDKFSGIGMIWIINIDEIADLFAIYPRIVLRSTNEDIGLPELVVYDDYLE